MACKFQSYIKAVVFIILALSVFSSCNPYTPLLKARYQPIAGKSYIFGYFTMKGHPCNIGLVIENTDNKKNYIIKFTRIPQISLIEVEPGNYEITKYIGYTSINVATEEKYPSIWPFNVQFKVLPNGAYYLADMAASFNQTNKSSGIREITITSIFDIETIKDNFEESRALLLNKHAAMKNTHICKAFLNP